MNGNDIRVAIQFLEMDESQETMALVCYDARDIPYVKRGIIQLLGQPRKQISHSLYYGNKELVVVPYHRDEIIKGYSKVFYVAHEDNKDWMRLTLATCGMSTAPYMVTNWFDEGDLYRAMRADGMSHEEVMGVLINEGVMTC